MKKEPFVYIILVSFNQRSDTLDCIRSLKTLNYKNYKIILVDNGSTDGLSKEILRNYPDINFIRLDSNRGAAMGRNIGMEQALDSDYIFFLDNDAVVEKSTLTELVKVAESDSGICAVGAKVYYYNEPNKIWNFGGRINWIKGKFSHTHQGEFDKGQFNSEGVVDTFPIGFGIVRTNVIKKVGKIDERYFIYYEETDWHIRMRKLGYKLLVMPRAKIWHKASSSLGKESPAFYYYRTRNRLLFMFKNTNKLKFFLFCLYFLYDFSYHTLLTLYLSKRIKELKASLLGIIDFLRGKLGKKILTDSYLSGPLHKIVIAKFIRYIKALLIHIITWTFIVLLYPWHTFKRLKFNRLKNKVGQILIIYMAEGLGDCILFSAVLPLVREKFKNSKISLLIFERFGEYFKDNPYIDQLFTYPDYRYLREGFMKFLGFSRYIKSRCAPDILIDFLPNRFIRPALFSLFIPNKLSIGFGYAIKKAFYDICIKIDWDKYFLDAIFDALLTLDIEKSRPQYWIPQTSFDLAIPKEDKFKGRNIVLAPGGKFNLLMANDYGGFRYYPELIKCLVENGFRLILVGAEYDKEPQSLSNNLSENRIINLLGKTSLKELFAIVKDYADLVVCNTSGLLYVALAVGVPCVFYAHPLENLKRWYPITADNEKYVALRDTEEDPVNVEKFFKAIINMLNFKKIKNVASEVSYANP